MVRSELERQGIAVTYGQDRLVGFDGDMRTMMQANIWLRTANRIYIELEKITIKNYHNSKSFLNVKSNYFTLMLDDKAEAEINVKAEGANIELSKNSKLKAFVAATEFKLDMYQKSTALIEGSATNSKIRSDNSCHLTAPKFVIGTVEIETDGAARCEINASIAITIAAAGKSQIELWGEQKITIKKFINNATIQKKEKTNS